MSDAPTQPDLLALLQALRAHPQVGPLLAQLSQQTAAAPNPVAQIPASLQPPSRTLPGPGFIPGTLALNPALAPQVPAGAPRPFAPGEMVHNPDGSWSSEVSMTVSGDKSFNNGQPTIIPSLWIKNGMPYVAKDEDEAVELAKQSGLTWPSYPTMDAAEAASNARESIWQTVGTQNANTISPLWTPNVTIEPPAATGIAPAPRAAVSPGAPISVKQPAAPVTPYIEPPAKGSDDSLTGQAN